MRHLVAVCGWVMENSDETELVVIAAQMPQTEEIHSDLTKYRGVASIQTAQMMAVNLALVFEAEMETSVLTGA